LGFYRRKGVADACITLQERSGVDVNLLLYLLWQASQGNAYAAEDVATLETVVAPWRQATVIPLRTVRRALKEPPGLVAGPVAEVFRNRIKAVELEAERLQQEAMYELAKAKSGGRPWPRLNRQRAPMWLPMKRCLGRPCRLQLSKPCLKISRR